MSEVTGTQMSGNDRQVLEACQEFALILDKPSNYVELVATQEGGQRERKGRALEKEEREAIQEWMKKHGPIALRLLTGQPLFEGVDPEEAKAYRDRIKEMEEVLKNLKAEYSEKFGDQVVQQACIQTLAAGMAAYNTGNKVSSLLPLQTVRDGKAPKRGRKADGEGDEGDDE